MSLRRPASVLLACAVAVAGLLQVSASTASAAGSTADCLQYANTFDSAANIPKGADIKPYTSAPPAVDAWFNSTDVEERGIWNPDDNRPWKFTQQFSRLLCYTSEGADVTAAYYFFRGTNASDSAEKNRPESDPETVFKALEWLAKNRNVKIKVLLDNTNTCTTSAPGQSCTNIMGKVPRAALEKRFEKIPNSEVTYCVNGCFNRARYGTYPYAIEHEKFFTVSKTDFPGAASKPMVISSSANLARSQIRNYRQEASLVYGDTLAWREFADRFTAMRDCAVNQCKLLGSNKTWNTSNGNLGSTVDTRNTQQKLLQEGSRKIWVDPILRRGTDSGRGTSITFSPGREADAAKFDVYVNQFDNVDCKTDAKIRLAMFKLTDGKAEKMASVLRDLKGRGCDVKMLMTSQGGQTVISKSVRSTLDKAKVDYKCTVDAMHTKLILIGPSTGNLGSILTGTQNMSVAGQLYSEEHVITFDAKKAVGQTRADIRAAYDSYQQEWTRLARGASKGRCG